MNNWWVLDYGDHAVLMIDDDIVATFNDKEAARLFSEDLGVEINHIRDMGV